MVAVALVEMRIRNTIRINKINISGGQGTRLPSGNEAPFSGNLPNQREKWHA